MNLTNSIKQTIYLLTFFLFISCEQTNSKQINKTDKKKLTVKQKPDDFLPVGYVIFEKVNGDLNNDGIDDCILIIKGTEKKQIIKDKYRGILDRNRRGIIILFKEKENFNAVVENYNCFSSENEDGGNYYAPELYVYVEKGNLFVNYGYGRYGYWKYNFKYQVSNFNLIGYDSSSGGVVIESETSINFLSKKKLEKININKNAEGGDEIFKETWKNINVNRLLKLSEIKDFDELDMTVY
jgi:hypothetical protein